MLDKLIFCYSFKELVELANSKGWDILITRNKRPMQQQADGLAI